MKPYRTDFEQEQFEAGIREYQKNIDVFRMKMDDYHEENKRLTTYTPQELQLKVSNIEHKLANLWQTQETDNQGQLPQASPVAQPYPRSQTHQYSQAHPPSQGKAVPIQPVQQYGQAQAYPYPQAQGPNSGGRVGGRTAGSAKTVH